MSMLRYFVFLIYVLSSIIGEVRPIRNGICTRNQEKMNVEFSKYFQVVCCMSLRVNCVAQEAKTQIFS